MCYVNVPLIACAKTYIYIYIYTHIYVDVWVMMIILNGNLISSILNDLV